MHDGTFHSRDGRFSTADPQTFPVDTRVALHSLFACVPVR